MNIHKAPSSYAVIPFYGAASIAFLALCVMMLFSVKAFGGHYFQPKILALTHTAVLGWGTMIIFGASYQLLPVIFEKNLFSSKLAFTSFLLFLPGTLLLVVSFWNFRTGIIMQTGGCLIVLGIFLFTVNAFLTARNSDRYSIQKLFIITSAIWLLITASIGLLLVFNLSKPIFYQSHLELLKLHAHSGIAGWFLLLIIGVGSKLIPMFLLSKSEKEQLLQWSFYLINSGLIAFLFDGYAKGVTWRSLVYGLLIIGGIILFMLYIFDVFKNRMRKEIDFQMKHTMISMVFLVLAIIFIPKMIFNPTELKNVLIYGMLIFMGWITSIIIGKTFKTLPFIVWNDKYKEHVGKKNLPMPKDLYRENHIKVQYYLYLVGIVSFIIGIKFDITYIIQVAGGILTMVALIYNYNVFKIIFHKPQIK